MRVDIECKETRTLKIFVGRGEYTNTVLTLSERLSCNVQIVGGSLAERAGLRNGDLVFELEGLRDLDINAIDRLLVTSREKIELVVHR